VANVTWQDDLETVRDSLVSPDGLCLVCGMADHRENCQHPDAAPSLARLEARLEQADKLADMVREYGFSDGLWEDVTGALAEWDGEGA